MAPVSVSCCLALVAVVLQRAASVQLAVRGSQTAESFSTSARVAAVARLEQEDHLVAVAAGGAWVRESHQTFSESSENRGKYGFYLHTYDKPEACINLLRKVRQFYPKEPVYIMSDGGMNFSGLCNSIGNCNFQWRPPANDRWNPLPFFNRIREAATWLNTTYTIMLEPDNEIRGKIATIPPRMLGAYAIAILPLASRSSSLSKRRVRNAPETIISQLIGIGLALLGDRTSVQQQSWPPSIRRTATGNP